MVLQAHNTNVIYKQVYLSNNILYLSEIWFDDLPEYHLIVHSSLLPNRLGNIDDNDDIDLD